MRGRAMAAAPDRNLEAVLTRERDRAGDIVRVKRARDEPRLDVNDRGDATQLVVVRIGSGYDSAAHARAQVIGVGRHGASLPAED